jgi:hypothetical protein
VVSTLASGLSEPSGAILDPSAGSARRGDHLVVVESGAHRLVRVPLAGVVDVAGFEHSTQRPVTEIAGGDVEIVVEFTPPPGQKVDDRFGPATQLQVGATPPALLRSGEGTGTDLVRTLVLDGAVGDGVLHVSARAASCDVDGGDGAACRIHQQDWGIPVRVTDAGAVELVLPLGGTADAG